MSVSLLEVIEAAGYDITTKEDALWLLSKQREFSELVEQCNDLLEKIEENEYNLEAAYERAEELRHSRMEDGIW